MMIRQRGFRIGQRVKLHDSTVEGGNAYPLPPGCHHGEEVTVIGFNHGYVRGLGDGRETTVFIVNIDSGWDEVEERKATSVDAACEPLECRGDPPFSFWLSLMRERTSSHRQV